MTKATAAELVQQHPAELIGQKIDVFDWLVYKQDKRLAKSPAGYLVKSIADDYPDRKVLSAAPSVNDERISTGQGPRRRGRAPPAKGGRSP